jgi:hypothetical protein
VQKFADSYKVLIEEIEQKSNRLARQARGPVENRS